MAQALMGKDPRVPKPLKFKFLLITEDIHPTLKDPKSCDSMPTAGADQQPPNDR